MSLTYITKCRVPGCFFSGAAPGLDGVMTGAIGAGEAEKVIGNLVAHIKKKHPHVYERHAARAAQFVTLFCLREFETQDPTGIEMLEFMRASLHAMTQKTALSDSTIREMAAKLGLQDSEQSRVTALICEIRDALIEQGKHAPREPGTQNGKPLLVKP
jgi:hypothetical protein